MRVEGSDGPQSTRLKLVFLIGALDVGGTERQLIDLAARVDRQQFHPIIYCFAARGPLADDAKRAGVEVRSADLRGLRPWKHPVQLLWRTLKMVRELRSLRPDILHALLFHAYTIGAFLSPLIGARVFVSSRRSLGHFKARRRAALLIERAANRFATVIVANSEAVRRDVLIQEGLAAERVIVIHNGIDVAPFAGCQGELVRREIGISSDAQVVGVLANFISYKGHEYFLAAWRKIRTAYPHAVAIFVGDGRTRHRVERLAAELRLASGVRFLGNRLDVPMVLASIDILVHPSEQEGFSNAILEGMAAGRPVIATDVGGNAEAVVQEETGLLVPSGDPAALAAAIERLLASPETGRAFGKAGQRRVEREFGMDRMTRAYERLYIDVLRTKAPPATASQVPA
jgi:glycosyltransferase involved in cell wall biosynthesis